MKTILFHSKQTGTFGVLTAAIAFAAWTLWSSTTETPSSPQISSSVGRNIARTYQKAYTTPPALCWQQQLDRQLPLLGHRNWIVIADSAYPAQTAPGLQVIYAPEDLPTVLQTVLNKLNHCKHIRPIVYQDQELQFLDDRLAPGISAFRNKIRNILGDRPTHSKLHIDMIHWLHDVADQYKVLVIKTDCTLPYTTVFLQLDCAYWSEKNEQILRQRIQAAQSHSSSTQAASAHKPEQ